MKKILIGLVSLMLTVAVMAEIHPKGKLTGTNASLVTYDHAFAGEMNGIVIFGVLDESIFTSEITIRKYGQTIRAEFKKQENNTLGGNVTYKLEDREVAFNITLNKIDPKTKQISLNAAGEEVVIAITSEGFADGHFINPTITFTLGGNAYEYHMVGEACYGMLAHFSMMLISVNLV